MNTFLISNRFIKLMHCWISICFHIPYNDPKTKHLLEVWKCLSFKYLVPNAKHALNAKIIYNEINNYDRPPPPPPPPFFFSFVCTLLVLCCRVVDSLHLICSFDCFVVGRWRLNSARWCWDMIVSCDNALIIIIIIIWENAPTTA